MRDRRFTYLLGWIVAVALLPAAGCDTVEPEEAPVLVVEGFLDAGRPLPPIRLRQTRPMWEPYPDDGSTAVTDAEVELLLGATQIRYRADSLVAGRYLPQESTTVPARESFELSVRWRAHSALARGAVPPPVAIDSVSVDVPDRPVEAILLDSLRLSDSLGVGARKGFIYPVEVTLWWTTDFIESGADTSFWIRAQLRPYQTFSSTVVNFFLKPEQVLRESSMARDPLNRRRWTGVYAIPVAAEADPLPAHGLKVSLLRSGREYAAFASSRDAPERREPRSNMSGAIGIFVGISVDSVLVHVQ